MLKAFSPLQPESGCDRLIRQAENCSLPYPPGSLSGEGPGVGRQQIGCFSAPDFLYTIPMKSLVRLASSLLLFLFLFAGWAAADEVPRDKVQPRGLTAGGVIKR